MKYFWQIFSACAVVVIIGLAVFIYNERFKEDPATPWIPEEYVIDAEIIDNEPTVFTVKVITSECGHQKGEIIKANCADKRYNYLEAGACVRIITWDKITEDDRDISVHTMSKLTQ